MGRCVLKDFLKCKHDVSRLIHYKQKCAHHGTREELLLTLQQKGKTAEGASVSGSHLKKKTKVGSI